MSAKQAKRKKLFGNLQSSDNGTKNDHTADDTNEIAGNSFAINGTDFESLFSIQIVMDKIMSYLTYKDVYKLSLSCRALRELSILELERRKNGLASKCLLYRLNNITEPFLQHPKSGARAAVHLGIHVAQQKFCELINQLHFRPKIAFLLTGNVKSREHQMWSRWFKRKLPHDCTVLNVLSKTAICGSIDNHVYEVHHNKFDGNCGLAYILLGTQRGNRSIHVFKSLKELVTLTDADARRKDPVKCILYFSRSHSRAQLSKILSVCKERNHNNCVAFGGLVMDSLASFDDDAYTSQIQCAGLVFSGADSEVMAASTIIEDMTDEQIRNSMISFRDSIPFDITDPTKNTICFLLSCIEHSPHVNYSSEYTASESDIFHTIFPSNIRVFGFSGHGEFGQVSGLSEEQKKVAYQFSCVIVLVQFPIR
ncbi:F-box only protein 22-like isoform X1 [Bradysia coprophila]|uniref:F-box only protein 22-like isoform X1 n=1 Tax=Bradysia coprophila TaxID=38358 RepID=UPI00187DB1E1|nr:F-box only protein 22-like isoform X1 [Bradysia coprophila]XP_037050904.1 F-box only protein 22-like isoform X1 [Bradysia coprophila]